MSGKLQVATLLLALIAPCGLVAQTLQSNSSPAVLKPLSSDSATQPQSTPLSGSRSAVLPVDEAFVLTAVIEGDRNLILSWNIQPNHYLYQDKLSVLDAQGRAIDLDLPAATSMTDEFFGETHVYFDALRLAIPLSTAGLKTADGTFKLDLQFQGCAKDLYCYPPQQRAIELSLPR